MAKIKKAFCEEKTITITYDFLESEKEKIYVCILNKSNEIARKPLRRKGEDVSIKFKFGDSEEADSYLKTYLEDEKQNIITEPLKIQSNQKQNLKKAIDQVKSYLKNSTKAKKSIFNQDLFHLLLKSIGAPFGCLLLIILFVKLCNSYRTPIEHFNINQAYFKNFKTIVVQGSLIFKEDMPDEVMQKVLKKIQLQLFVNNIAKEVQQIKKANFFLNFNTVIDKNKHYYFQFIYNKNRVTGTKRKVAFEENFPIAFIKNADFQKDQSVKITVVNIYKGQKTLEIGLSPEIAKKHFGSLIASKKLKGNQHEMVILGPIQRYSENFLIKLVPVNEENNIIDYKEITTPYPSGKIISSAFSTIDTIRVQGKWGGPENIKKVTLEVLDRGQIIYRNQVTRSFYKNIHVKKLENTYQVRLKHNSNVLSKIPVEIPKLFDDYIAMVKSMPKLAKGLNSLLKVKTINIGQLQNLYKISNQYKKKSYLILAKPQNRVSGNQLNKYYSVLTKIFYVLIEQIDKSTPRSNDELLKAVAKKQELENSIKLLNNLIWKYHTELSRQDYFLILSKYLKEHKIEEKKQVLLEYINTCALNKNLLLGIDICSDALKKFPDTWQFLLARYNLYKLIYDKNKYTDAEKFYKQKTDQDYRRLIKLLQNNFTRELEEKDYSNAYILGMQLLKLKPSFYSVQIKIDQIKKMVPLELKLKAFRNNLKVKFSYESLKDK